MTNRSYQKLNWLYTWVRDLFLVIGIAVFLLVLIHFMIGAARWTKHAFLGIKSNEEHTLELKKSPVVAGYDQYDEFFLEGNDPNAKLLVLPYYHWRRNAYEGKAINVDAQLVRKTIKTPEIGAKKVFMFGGSALWGASTPDKYTIPSQLQALLGPKYDVYNFGESAFVSVQEFNLLLEQLSKGFIPDMVIFYDGPIDIYTGLYSPGRPRHPQFTAEDYTSKSETSYLLRKLLEKTNYIAITERIKKWRKQDAESQWETNILPKLEENGRETVMQYAHFMKQVHAIGKAYGFEVYHFWQPVLLTETRQLTDHEQKMIETASAALLKSFQIAQKLVQQHLVGEENFYDIADVFKDVNEPLYFDLWHTGPKGNELVAKRIYQLLALS